MKQIAYITDVHLDERSLSNRGINTRRNWEVVITDVAARGIDRVVFGGDIGEPSATKWFFDSLQGFDFTLTLGNHDSFLEVAKFFTIETDSKQQELYYSQENDTYKFIYLDSRSATISQKQLEWFKKEVHTAKKIILFIHHPLLAVDVFVDKKYPLSNRAELVAELINLKIEVTVFCGHYHCEDTATVKNIRQYVAPACSYQIEKGTKDFSANDHAFGYRIITLSTTHIATEVVMFPR